jgi:hypothetical protein
MKQLLEEIRLLEARIAQLERELAAAVRESAACATLLSISGVGLLAATALVAATVSQRIGRPIDPPRHWALAVQARANHKKASCALANKLARACFATLRDHTPFDMRVVPRRCLSARSRTSACVPEREHFNRLRCGAVVQVIVDPGKMHTAHTTEPPARSGPMRSEICQRGGVSSRNATQPIEKIRCRHDVASFNVGQCRQQCGFFSRRRRKFFVVVPGNNGHFGALCKGVSVHDDFSGDDFSGDNFHEADPTPGDPAAQSGAERSGSAAGRAADRLLQPVVRPQTLTASCLLEGDTHSP